MNHNSEFVRRCTDSEEFKDASILKILAPTADDRDRSAHINAETIRMPSKADSEWRIDKTAGKLISTDSTCVVSNHFKLDSDNLVQVIYHYDVKIYPYARDPESKKQYVDKEDDVSADTDIALNYDLIRRVREHANTQWTPAEGFGITYDGHSQLFSTRQLFSSEGVGDEEFRQQSDFESFEWPKDLKKARGDIRYGAGGAQADGGVDEEKGGRSPPKDLESYSDDFKKPELNKDFCLDLIPQETAKSRKYHVRLREVAIVKAPTTLSQAGRESNDQSYVRALDIALLAFIRNQLHKDKPEWTMNGCKAFNLSGSDTVNLDQPNFLAMKGYSVSLRSCISGTFMWSVVL